MNIRAEIHEYVPLAEGETRRSMNIHAVIDDVLAELGIGARGESAASREAARIRHINACAAELHLRDLRREHSAGIHSFKQSIVKKEI